MKTILTAFLLWTFHFNCTAQWIELNIGTTTASYFTDVYAFTPDILIVVGNNGTIIKTTDGGITWQQKPSGTNQLLKKVSFTANVGYIIGNQGVLLKSIDGGDSWAAIDTGRNVNFESLSSLGENFVYIAYVDNLLKSADGGNTWQSFPLDFLSGDIQFLTQDIGYASKVNGRFSKTVDGGASWQELLGFKPFYFINKDIGFYDAGGLLKTTDGGNTFEYTGTGSGSVLSSLLAINENTVWGIYAGALNGDGTTTGVIKMSDSGTGTYISNTWWDNDTNLNMNAIYFANESTGYIVGYKNAKAAIWKNVTGINVPGPGLKALDETLTSFKVYPNPASDKIKVTTSDHSSKEIAIILTDTSGRNIYNEKYNNSKEVIIDVKSFAKGTYVLTIKTQTQSYAQKLIIQ